jgi:hypothetical protein
VTKELSVQNKFMDRRVKFCERRLNEWKIYGSRILPTGNAKRTLSAHKFEIKIHFFFNRREVKNTTLKVDEARSQFHYHQGENK